MAFRKNKSRAPINIFITPWPTNLMGLMGVPINNRSKISTPIIEITIIGSIRIPLFNPFLLTYVQAN
jgi:hypothetical protein